MRVLRGTIRLFGWLMTPFVVWGASVGGAWAGSWIGRLIPSATAAMALSVTLAVGWGAIALLWWIKSLRRAATHSRRRRARKPAPPPDPAPAEGKPAESDSPTLEYDEAVA